MKGNKLKRKSETHVTEKELKDLSSSLGNPQISFKEYLRGFSMPPAEVRDIKYRTLMDLREVIGFPKYQPAT